MARKNREVVRYTIFPTEWGYFGLAGTGNYLIRTHLPCPRPERIKSHLLNSIETYKFEPNLFSSLQKQIKAYFQGASVNFTRDIPVLLEGLGEFSISALKACRTIKYGRTLSYKELAIKAGRPNSSRAVGSVLAQNPLPLIIPCHRVVRCDGKLGGFSGPGGVKLKKKLLALERQSVMA